MILCGIVFLAAALSGLFFRKAGKKSRMNMCIILTVCAALGIIAELSEKQKDIWVTEEQLRRQENGEGDYVVALELEIPGVLKEDNYEIVVPEQRLTRAQEREYLKAARTEIESTFLGENISYEKVQTSVDIRETYQDGKVVAEWSFNNYRVIGETGEIVTEDLAEGGETIQAVVCLACEDTEEEFSFEFRVIPLELEENERISRKLKEELINNASMEAQKTLIIPQEVEGYTLIWTQQKSYTALKILALGVFVVICYPQIELSRRQEAEKKREKELMMQYPDMVSKLTLLLGAGMTLYGAWKRIATSYEKKRKNNTIFRQAVYEEMLLTCREIESGVGEARAYEGFGERCGLRQYRRFSNLISQNLKKGTKGLSVLLEEEAENAFEERKSEARKYGEEAGTKLLLPMILMFGIVIVIIMVPAIISFQM